jgi:molybdenum cofactor guanylyltransferase
MIFSAVLLAGGESRRMGRDKATAIFQGETLWQRQLSLLRQLEPAQIFLSARTEQVWRPTDIELLPDKVPLLGPVSGIAAALTRMKTSHLLVLAIDMPFLTEDHLRHLLRLSKAGCGVVAISGGRAEPLAAIYPKKSLPEFTAALSSNDRSMQSLVRQLAAKHKVGLAELSQAEAEHFRSVNTPEDLIARLACR